MTLNHLPLLKPVASPMQAQTGTKFFENQVVAAADVKTTFHLYSKTKMFYQGPNKGGV